MAGPAAASVKSTILPDGHARATVAAPSPATSLPPKPVAIPLRVRDPKHYTERKAAANGAYSSWAARHGVSSESTAPGPAPLTAQSQGQGGESVVFNGLNMPGLSAWDQVNSSAPPDTTGAIGPNHYVEMVNSTIGVYDRSTLGSPPLARLDERSFVNAEYSPCDGQVQWDQQARRWLYVVLECGAGIGVPDHNALYFGWSKSDDPRDLSAGWCKYKLATPAELDDYPKLGHDDHHILIGANAFRAVLGEEGLRGDARLWVLPKPQTGDSSCPAEAPTATSFALLNSPGGVAVWTPEPANIADSSPTGYVVATTGTSSLFKLFEVSGSATQPIVSARSDVSVPSWGAPASVPQPGTQDRLDSLDGRLTQAVAHIDPAIGGEAIWIQHTVAGPGGGPSVVRWYELQPGATAPHQMGTVQGSGDNFVFNAAISPTSRGDGAAIFYNTGGGSQLADVRARIRSPATAAGTTEGETVLARSEAADADFTCPSQATGTGPATRPECRWGDYAGASPDPANPTVVWGSDQLSGPARTPEPQWKTQNAAVNTSAVDTAAPTPTITSPTDNSRSADTTPTIEGSAGTAPGDEDHVSVKIYTGSSATGSPLQTNSNVPVSAGSWSVDATPLPAGSYTAQAEQSDDVGHSGSSNTRSFTVDTADPLPSGGGGSGYTGGTGNTDHAGGTRGTDTGGGGSFRVTKTSSSSNGTVTADFNLPGPGQLDALGTIKPPSRSSFTAARTKAKKTVAVKAKVTVRAAGLVELKLKLTRRAKHILEQKRKLKVKTKFTFTPRGGGQPISLTRTMSFKLKKTHTVIVGNTLTELARLKGPFDLTY